jgi:hypothetical protein
MIAFALQISLLCARYQTRIEYQTRTKKLKTIKMNSRKKGTRQPLSEREKTAVVRYCEELKTEKPAMLTKEFCDRASLTDI